jgi:hypothetical protein
MPKDFAPLVNGIQYSFVSIRTNILGVSLAGLRAIEWEQSKEIEDIYATGSEVNSRSYGKNIATSSITVLFSDLLALQDAAPDKEISEIAPFSIIVAFIEGSRAVTFVLENVQFKGYKFSGKADDMKFEITLPLILTKVRRKR